MALNIRQYTYPLFGCGGQILAFDKPKAVNTACFNELIYLLVDREKIFVGKWFSAHTWNLTSNFNIWLISAARLVIKADGVAVELRLIREPCESPGGASSSSNLNARGVGRLR